MVEPIGVLASAARDPEAESPPFDTTVPHPSRMYDYLRWRHDRPVPDDEPDLACYVAVGRKPG